MRVKENAACVHAIHRVRQVNDFLVYGRMGNGIKAALCE